MKLRIATLNMEQDQKRWKLRRDCLSTSSPRSSPTCSR